jgi:acyl-CoA synthetase (AMP-forming)/AMP-acid ligase II
VNGATDDGVPFGTRLQELAKQVGNEPALVTLAPDGSAQRLTFAQLDACANQWGRALTVTGTEFSSLVALGIPNSAHRVLATLGCWKIGAVPVPMRWDLPECFSSLSCLLGGDRLAVLEKFDAAVVVNAIEQYRVTNFTATPTMLARVAALPGIHLRDFSTVVWILQGAAVMPHALLRTWFDLLSPE